MLPTYTVPSAPIAGDDAIPPPFAGKFPSVETEKCRWPSADTQYIVPSLDPKYTLPALSIAGDERTLPPVMCFHFNRKVRVEPLVTRSNA